MGLVPAGSTLPREAGAVRAAALAVAVLALVHGGAPDSAPAGEQVSLSKVGAALLTSCPKEVRGLSSPCAVPCTVSGVTSRLCRGCCIALGLSAEVPAAPAASTPAAGSASAAGLTQPEDVLEFFAIRNATLCLAPCVRFTAKQIRTALEDPKTNSAILTGMATDLENSNPGREWKKILESGASGRYASLAQLCEKELQLC